MMKRVSVPRHVSISTRISVLLALIILATMGGFSAVSLMKQERDSIDALSRSTMLLGQTTEKILRLNMLKNKRDEISAAIKEIVGNEGIRSVRILNHEGIIKFSSQPSDIEKHISPTNSLCANCHAGGDSMVIRPVNSFYSSHFDKRTRIIYSSLPIYNSPACYNGDCHATAGDRTHLNPTTPIDLSRVYPVHDSSETILGFIQIEVSANKIMANIDRSRVQLILLTIIIALLASTVTYFSTRRLVGNPVKKLVEGTRRVAQGDFNHEIPKGRAELGVLADSFNQMQRQLLTTQSQLIESERLASVGKLADEIANEINNPLTGIIVYSESLLEQSEPGSHRRSDYEVIIQEALKIRESVRNILSLARKEKPSFAPVDLKAIVNHAVAILRKLSNFRNIRIVTAIPKSFPKVSADQGLLQQVFLNLFLIFSDNMKAGGVLTVSVQQIESDGKIQIRIAATEGNIAQSVLQALSDEGTSTDAGNIERTRISLAVCRDIIAIHKGRIFGSSEPGAESSITIELSA